MLYGDNQAFLDKIRKPVESMSRWCWDDIGGRLCVNACSVSAKSPHQVSLDADGDNCR